VKKIFLIIFLITLFSLPLVSLSAGLVPCGRTDSGATAEERQPCTFCHLFVMIDRVLDFLLFKIVPVLAALMIAIGGFMYIFAFGKPEMISQAKRLFTAIAIGLLIIYGAWVLINTFFAMIGLSDFGLKLTGPDKWFIINCQ